MRLPTPFGAPPPTGEPSRRTAGAGSLRGMPTTPVSLPSPTGDPQWRRPLAALQTAGAALFLAGIAATPWEEERTVAAYHDALAASPQQAQVAALLLWAAFALLGAAAFALLGTLGVPRSWPTRIGAACVVLGATTLPGLLMTDAYDLALAQALPRTESAPISEAVDPMFLSAVLGLAGGMLGLLVGPTILWWAAWRRRLVGPSVPALITAGWAIGYATQEVPVMLAGCATLLAGSGIAAATLWRAEPTGLAAPSGKVNAEPQQTALTPIA